jgi:hypothetical protein
MQPGLPAEEDQNPFRGWVSRGPSGSQITKHEGTAWEFQISVSQKSFDESGFTLYAFVTLIESISGERGEGQP